MTILVVTTESHRGLYTDFFLATAPADAAPLEKKLAGTDNGDYLSRAWQDGVTAKLRWALEYAENNPGSVYVFSDVDIQFFPGFRLETLRAELEQSGADILWMKETPRKSCIEVNAGFYVARGTPYVTGLLRDAIRWCESAESANDQTAINALLEPGDFGRRWGVLSHRYYARTHGFPPARDIVLHHATFTHTVAEKVVQLRRVRGYLLGGMRGRWSAIAAETWDYARTGRLPGMLWRRLRRSASRH